jgi:hypothetical protein
VTVLEVRLCRNPWQDALAGGHVYDLLWNSAMTMSQRLRVMIEADDTTDVRDSFAAVLLDPTRPRDARTIRELVFAIILIGPDSARLVPNGAAKADGHERHDTPMGILVNELPHLLCDGDFAWGNSAEYKRMFGGGSGRSAEEDGELVLELLTNFVDPLLAALPAWLKEKRSHGSHGWWNNANKPGNQYQGLLDIQPLLVSSLEF